MEMNQWEKQKVFLEELSGLERSNYISRQEHEHLQDVYEQYQMELQKKEKEAIFHSGPEQAEREVKVKKPPKVKKKKLTPEQSREIKITWSLILGVIMVLISGLYVATSNWTTMTSVMKTVSIGFVSMLFFGISWFSGKVLKIEKTAFAFLVLGSLFLPIVVLSAGFFELFGPWLSVYGGGKYVLGILSTAVGLPVYFRNALVHRSRLFVWITYLTLSLAIAFVLGSLSLPVDVFYFGLVLYNVAMLIVYHRMKDDEGKGLFIKELPGYSQLNLIVSTLLLLAFFENATFYSFNVLLTAVLYISMVYVYNTPNYHFVFTALMEVTEKGESLPLIGRGNEVIVLHKLV